MITAVREVSVINTKFASPDLEDVQRVDRRLARFDLQRVAARLLPKNTRLANCNWLPIDRKGVEIRKHPETHATHYARGIAHCGLVHLCMVCASKIAAYRRKEISQAVENWIAKGFAVVMVTFTLQHHRGELLRDLLTVLLATLREFRAGKGYQIFKAAFGIAGDIKGLEFTLSHENGWHPHVHMLFFLEVSLPTKGKKDAFALVMRERFTTRYTAILEKLGGFADDLHGVDVKIADREASDYLTKGLGFEMANGAGKSGHGEKHYTIFELLELAKGGDEWASKKFQEYAEAIRGVNSIRWSKGLRKLLRIGAELTDEDIVTDVDAQGAEHFYLIEKDIWRSIRLIRGIDRRAIHLEVARHLDPAQFGDYLKSLRHRSLEDPSRKQNKKVGSRRDLDLWREEARAFDEYLLDLRSRRKYTPV